MTVNEMLAAALEYDESLMAHTLYAGIKDGVIVGGQEADGMLFERIDLEKGYQLHQENFLGIHSVKLFSSPLEEGKFAMFFAEDEETARKLFKKEFKKTCNKMHHLHYGLDVSAYDMEIKQHQTWRELRDSLPELPAYAGIFEKDRLVIGREKDAIAKAKVQKAQAEKQRPRNH